MVCIKKLLEALSSNLTQSHFEMFKVWDNKTAFKSLSKIHEYVNVTYTGDFFISKKCVQNCITFRFRVLLVANFSSSALSYVHNVENHHSLTLERICKSGEMLGCAGNAL